MLNDTAQDIMNEIERRDGAGSTMWTCSESGEAEELAT